MDTEAKTSKAAAFGRSVAQLWKKSKAAERQLIAKSGALKKWVKSALILLKVGLALAAIAVSLWTLVLLVPLIMLAMLMTNGDRHEETMSDMPQLLGSGEQDGYRYGWDGFGYYMGMFRIDSRKDWHDR